MQKKYRIKKSEEFQEIITHKEYLSAKSFVIYTKNKRESYARVGISVPKKIGNAVTRNKAKRQIREMIRPLYKENWSKDIIIIVKKPYLLRTFQENRNNLENILKQVKI